VAVGVCLADSALPTVAKAGATVLSALWGAWYWVFVARARGWRKRLWILVPSFFLSVALASALSWIHGVFVLLLFSFYGIAFGVLPFRWAVPTVVLCSLALAVRYMGFRGEKSLTANLVILAGFLAMAFMDAVLGLFIGSIARQNSERKRMIEELEAARSELLTAEREAGALGERQRLAGEIHDTIAQGLTSIVLQLETAEAELDRDPGGARQRMRRALATAREGLGEARRALWALRPDVLEREPFHRALERVVKRWSEMTGVEAQTSVTGEMTPLPPSLEVTLLRAVQEALANVHKHAHARRVSVTMSYMGGELSVDVQDDGRGFDPAAKAGGYGLPALRERVEGLGGRVVVESTPGEGTTVAIQVPLRAGSGEGQA